MKNLRIYLFPVFACLAVALFSCSSPEERHADAVADKVCEVLSAENIDADLIMKAKETYMKEIEKLGDEAKKPLFLTAIKKSLEECFLSLKYSRQIQPTAETELLGSGAKYFKLDSAGMKIDYEPASNAGLVLKVKIEAKQSFNIEKEENLRVEIAAFYESGLLAGTYKIYPNPDFIKALRKGSGTITLSSFLEPVWDAFAEDPFSTAAVSFERVTKLKNFKIFINVDAKPEEAAAEIEKRTDDFVDSDLDLDAAQNQFEEPNPESEDLLISFEKSVGDYIAYVKNTKNKDLSSLANARQILNKAKSIRQRIERTSDRMSGSQIERFNRALRKLESTEVGLN